MDKLEDFLYIREMKYEKNDTIVMFMLCNEYNRKRKQGLWFPRAVIINKIFKDYKPTELCLDIDLEFETCQIASDTRKINYRNKRIENMKLEINSLQQKVQMHKKRKRWFEEKINNVKSYKNQLIKKEEKLTKSMQIKRKRKEKEHDEIAKFWKITNLKKNK